MTISPYGQELLSFLLSKESEKDREAEEEIIRQIDGCNLKLHSSLYQISAEAFLRLQTCRASVSHSLLRDPLSITQWNNGQTLIDQWIAQGQSITLENIINLNTVIIGVHHGWRRCPIFTAMVKHVHPDEIEAIMGVFFSTFSDTLAHKHKLYAAFLCRYWILSIHPFFAGNGRTSQLLADFILLKYGYPPQAFLSTLDALLIGEPHHKSYMTPHRAFMRFAQTILNAYKILA